MREQMKYLVSERRNLGSKCKVKMSREHAKCLPDGVADSHSCYPWGEPGQPHAGGRASSSSFSFNASHWWDLHWIKGHEPMLPCYFESLSSVKYTILERG
ncbi:hypothetical protein TNIN_436851 [Trichonephila inaurata madagascariensis]|uniref:Uncharacterized protein n=1 Tax=Trichonephila inaurata madagascariensis TaxID=2747483 RepID=A0A8X6YTE4_9ARAC|nr:hypothetical protein TNIN_436851 [Trichonephila inaurata madagascariensis]